ncbi:hypothetical protein A5634_25455 [Mycobacterium asiaticum]|uniref:Uncharacterized protein n=1 Tax=Mycobacterium asiaticum TaxID=1790 RepID=A0A1A3NZY5_MYCAS|nr:hypothetical protein [Mycobacterium asiaticum]OBK25912.1 hypothetical protein A5634_25455 [Mycobacterium asiaticum]
MSLHSDEITEVGTEPPVGQQPENDRGRVRRGLVNWLLAVLTVPAAALIMVFAVAAAMSMAACSAAQCPDLGPSGFLYGVLFYGAPVVAGLTIIASFFTALRRNGWIVPVVGLALLLADFVAIALLF